MEEMMATLLTAEAVAVDCEMDSFWSYWGGVCLVQVSNGNEDWIIDPLATPLDPMAELMASESITKIFHDAEYDIRQLKRAPGFSFANIFDTRAAAAITGVEAPGLGSILLARFGVAVDKKHQRADWTKRPLSPSMLSYAQSDVAYLHRLMDQLKAELEALDRRAILETEHDRLCALEGASEPYPAKNYSRIKGSSHLNGIERRRLSELYQARSIIAERHDRAPFRLISNHALLALSRRPELDPARYDSVSGINRRLSGEIGPALVEAVHRADAQEPIDRHPPKNPLGLGRRDRDRHQALRKFRTAVSKRVGIDGSLLLRRDLLLALATMRPTKASDLEALLAPWQMKLFGTDLLNVKG